jgi:translation initiation factor IF-2
MSKKALLELQGEALLQRERHRLDEETMRHLPSAHKRVLKVGGSIRVGDLAHEMSVKAAEVVRALFMNGMMVTLTQSIDFDTAALIAEDFGYQVEPSQATDDELLVNHVDSEEELVLRPPVVTVMGHVDHGKTSLLDKIREANVASGEAGGITQHIGAYSVDCPSGAITFLDTPGHAAFSAMRARGAEITDVVVLVVAADDGIKPQTAEAIKHAKAAKVPLLVALNKMDKEGARPDNILQELTAHELVPEEWGGDVQVQKLSAKTGEGVDELLEKLALQAEVLELQSNPSKPAIGSVVEAQLDRGRGAVATVLVQEGTLRKGDIIVAGQHYGRVRAMYDDQGFEVLEAGPSFPVAVLGLSGVPSAGDQVNVADEKIAKEVAERRSQRLREAELAVGARINLESFMAHGAPTNIARQLKLVIKGDVQGSVEALKQSLTDLSGPKVEVRVIYSGVGAITANDVNLAVASEAVVIGFNIRPDTKGAEAASQEGIDLRCYKVIYDVVDDVRAAMEGMLEPIRKENYLGRAEVRDTFRAPKLGTVAGCLVMSGLLRRSAQVRLLRDHQEIYVGELSSLRRFKDDVPEVKSGTECGMGLVGWSDLQAGDLIECFDVEEIRAKLDEHNVAPDPEPEVEPEHGEEPGDEAASESEA